MTAVHILIAEDEKHLRLGLGLVLRQAGYRVTAAENGLQALERMLELAAGSIRVDLLITDIQMPYLDGIVLLDRLREKGFAIPAIGISGLGDKELVAELRRLGCREYLDKPFTPREILSRVERVLEQSRTANAEQVVSAAGPGPEKRGSLSPDGKDELAAAASEGSSSR